MVKVFLHLISKFIRFIRYSFTRSSINHKLWYIARIYVYPEKKTWTCVYLLVIFHEARFSWEPWTGRLGAGTIWSAEVASRDESNKIDWNCASTCFNIDANGREWTWMVQRWNWAFQGCIWNEPSNGFTVAQKVQTRAPAEEEDVLHVQQESHWISSSLYIFKSTAYYSTSNSCFMLFQVRSCLYSHGWCLQWDE